MNGVIYVATGRRYVEEARFSAFSVKKHNSDINVQLVTDAPLEDDGPFDYVDILEEPKYEYGDKILGLPLARFERSLYLDTDTRVVADLSCYFELLEFYDIAYAHEPYRQESYRGVPEAFAEPNAGLFAFRRGELTEKLFADWKIGYERSKREEGHTNDQPSFREAIFRSESRSLVLPPEYNLRTCYPFFIGYAGKVRVVHGPRNDSLIKRLEVAGKHRVFLPSFEQFDGECLSFVAETSDSFYKKFLVRIVKILRRFRAS